MGREKVYSKIKGTTSKVFFALIVVFFLLFAASLIFVFFILFNSAEAPEANIGNRHYDVISDTHYPSGYVIDLSHLGVEPLKYGYRKAHGNDLPFINHTTFLDSLADDINEPEEVKTLSYDIWESGIPFMLDQKEKSLQKQMQSEPVMIELDYGAQKAYWIGNSLLLRYENVIIFFNSETTDNVQALLNSEQCAKHLYTVMDEYESYF